MGIRKSNITPSINVDDMLKSAEISHEIEAEKQDVDKLLVEIREAKRDFIENPARPSECYQSRG